MAGILRVSTCSSARTVSRFSCAATAKTVGEKVKDFLASISHPVSTNPPSEEQLAENERERKASAERVKKMTPAERKAKLAELYK